MDIVTCSWFHRSREEKPSGRNSPLEQTNNLRVLHSSEHQQAAERRFRSTAILPWERYCFQGDPILENSFRVLEYPDETCPVEVSACRKNVVDYAKGLDDVKLVPQAINFFRRLVFLPLGMLQEMLTLFHLSSLAFFKLGNHLAKEDFHWLLSYPIYDNERPTSSELPILYDNDTRLEINTRTFLEWLIHQALQLHVDASYIVTLLKFSCELQSERYTEALEKRLSNQLHNLKLESLQALKEQTALSIINRFRENVRRFGNNSPSEEMLSARSLVNDYLLYCDVRHSIVIYNHIGILPDHACNDTTGRFLDHHLEERKSGSRLPDYEDSYKFSEANASHVDTKWSSLPMPHSIPNQSVPQVGRRTSTDSVGRNERPSVTDAAVKEPQRTLQDLKKKVLLKTSVVEGTASEEKKTREEMKMAHQRVVYLERELNKAMNTIKDLQNDRSTANECISELRKDLQTLETAHAKLSEADSGSSRVDGPAPAHLKTALSGFRQVVATFTQRLLNFFEQKGVDPHKIVSHTLNHIVQQDRTGLKNVLISQAVNIVFENFENEQFQAGGETSIDVVSRCNDRFMESSGLKGGMAQEIYKKNSKFQAFCDEKWALLWRSFMHSGNDSFVDISSDTDVLFSDFQKVSLSAWKIHCLAFSFNPPASIIRVKENIRVDDIHVELIRAFDEDWTEKEKLNAFSAIMIFPGFRIRSNVIPCQVYPKIL